MVRLFHQVLDMEAFLGTNLRGNYEFAALE